MRIAPRRLQVLVTGNLFAQERVGVDASPECPGRKVEQIISGFGVMVQMARLLVRNAVSATNVTPRLHRIATI
jgi:hypothetical protein